MATKIKELYEKNAKLAAGDGGPDALKVDANANIDQTLYSNGSPNGNLSNKGDGSVDEAGMNAVLNRPLNPYKGNRYGFGVAATSIGDPAGYVEWPTRKLDGEPRPTWNDTKPYGKSPKL